MVSWTARLEGLAPGAYEFRARTVDLNGFAQPEPRPYQKSGMNLDPLPATGRDGVRKDCSLTDHGD